MTTSIYTLSDPSTSMVRYVGKTNFPERRLKEHISDTESNYRTKWIRFLKVQSLKPIFEVIDEVSESEWEFWEQHYISLFKSWGYKLTNGTPGGDGIGKGTKLQIPRSKKHLEKIKATKIKNGTWKKPHSEETINHLKTIDRSYLNSKESIAKRIGTVKSWPKEKLEEYNKSRTKHKYKAVKQYDLEGNFIKEWEHIGLVQKELKIQRSSIIECCRKHYTHAGGFIWEYKISV